MNILRGFRVAAIALVVAACGQSTASPSNVTPPPATATAEPVATTPPASLAPAASAIPVMPEPEKRIPLPGTAPAAMVVAQEGVWVYSIESGDVTLINDTSGGTSGTSIHVGGFGSHIVLGRDGRTLFVARFETGGSGSFLVAINSATGAVTNILTGTIGALGALTVDEDGYLYALEKADRLLRIDPGTLASTATAAVDIDDEHMEVVIAAGAAWVSSDHTPLRRLSLPDLKVTDTIEVGGGIPFVERGGLIWGVRPGTLWVLDPATKAISREIQLPGVEEILALDVETETNDAWLAVRMTGRVGAVLRIDLVSGAIIGTSPVSLPAAVKIVGPEVYVASYLDNEFLVYRR